MATPTSGALWRPGCTTGRRHPCWRLQRADQRSAVSAAPRLSKIGSRPRAQGSSDENPPQGLQRLQTTTTGHGRLLLATEFGSTDLGSLDLTVSGGERAKGIVTAGGAWRHFPWRTCAYPSLLLGPHRGKNSHLRRCCHGCNRHSHLRGRASPTSGLASLEKAFDTHFKSTVHRLHGGQRPPHPLISAPGRLASVSELWHFVQH